MSIDAKVNDGFDNDKFHEECGIFGIINSNNAVSDALFSMHSLQHRGQEGCGICYFNVNDDKIQVKKDYGIVSQTLMTDELLLKNLHSTSAIGHLRYSTSGNKTFTDVQPFYGTIKNLNGEDIDIAIAHNGNLINTKEIRDSLTSRGANFKTNIDSEVFLHSILLSDKNTIEDRIQDSIQNIKGAYAVIVLTKNKLIGFKDRNGIRPLSLGVKKNSDGTESYCFSSESVGFDAIHASQKSDVKEGEMVVVDIDKNKSVKITSRNLFENSTIARKFCVFEYIYFARPDSILEQNSVYNLRKEFGRILAKKSHIQADIIVPVPDSGVPSAIGYSVESKIPFELGLIRSHYSGRSFIAPTQEIRENKVLLKHNVNKSIIFDKKVILVDDSIVRGTTSKKIVKMIKDAGAKEIHLVISSPPTIHSCYYGIDTPKHEDLIANVYKENIQEIAKFLGVNSLVYLDIKDVYDAIKTHSSSQFCDMCFTKNKIIL